MNMHSSLDPEKVTQKAGLRYVSDRQPGIRRQKAGRGFSYIDIDGQRIRDRAERERLKSLAIPPSWTEVWICPDPNGHLQATGRDAKGRKQYRYHPEWRKLRSLAKFDRLVPFGTALSVIREQTDAHLRMHGLPREKVLALVVHLLEDTLIRVGNQEYAKRNRSYGLTTLRDRHIDISGSTVQFEFTGKSGIQHQIELKDRRLANIIKRCSGLPGYTVFQYLDENGERQQIDSGEVNEYLQHITGEDFTSKEFRTWAGTVFAAQELKALGLESSETQAKKHVVQAVKATAKQLGNRPATCRKYYVHPGIIETYLDGSLLSLMEKAERHSDLRLDDHEQAVLAVLERVAVWES